MIRRANLRKLPLYIWLLLVAALVQILLWTAIVFGTITGLVLVVTIVATVAGVFWAREAMQFLRLFIAALIDVFRSATNELGSVLVAQPGRARKDQCDLDRPVASSALHFVGNGTFGTEIVGESHYQRVLEMICGGRTEDGAQHLTTAVLVHEDGNPYDDKAVRVEILSQKVGYLNKTTARRHRKKLQQAGYSGMSATCSAVIVGGWDRGVNDRGYFGVRLDLSDAHIVAQ
jgi:hypothetical protein